MLISLTYFTLITSDKLPTSKYFLQSLQFSFEYQFDLLTKTLFTVTDCLFVAFCEMSDSSDQSDSDYSENYHGGDEDVPDNVEDEWTDFEEDPDPDEAVENTHMKDDDLLSKISLCSKHKSGFMVPHSCKMCAAALGLIKDTEIVEKLVLNTKPSGSTLVSRYSGRCDTVDPTLVLSSDTIQNALNIFTKGVFKDQRQWSEVIRKFLCLPADQHELLNLDIQQEEILNQFRKDLRFQNIFKYGNELAKELKKLRLSCRPLFCLMERVNDDFAVAKHIAEEAGVSFPDPDHAPPRVGVNVPRNGRTILDLLRYLEFDSIFPVPDISGLPINFRKMLLNLWW